MLGPEALSTLYAIALSLFQLAGFATCALLLASRDRSQLLASENRSIGRLAVGALLVIPFVVTDFQALAPDMPVRLGALGALLVVTAVLIAGGSAETRRQGILMTVLRVSSVRAARRRRCLRHRRDVDAAQIMRFCAVAIAGVLTIGLMTDTLRAFFEAQAPGMLNSVAASAAVTREQLIAELMRQPLFESARAASREPNSPPTIRRCCAICWPRARAAPGRKRPGGCRRPTLRSSACCSLLAANNATHIIVLSHDPVDLFVLAVPVMLADPATETALALVRRILAVTPENA